MRSVLAVIPARGGSKGIVRKNLRPVGGRPLVARSVDHARESRLITRIVVSTDDEEIAAVARDAGAEVPFMRPAELAGDEVLDLPVFAHVLETLRVTEGYTCDAVVHLRPTAPLRRGEWIDQAVESLRARPDVDSVRSVSRVREHPYRMFRIDDGGLLEPILSEPPAPYLLRRQDLPEIYHYNCVIDVTRPATIFRKGSMTGDRILPFVQDPDDVIDVDSPRDLEIARFLLERT